MYNYVQFIAYPCVGFAPLFGWLRRMRDGVGEVCYKFQIFYSCVVPKVMLYLFYVTVLHYSNKFDSQYW